MFKEMRDKQENDEEARIEKEMKLPAHRVGLPGNGDAITVSAFLPAYKAGRPADLPVTRATAFFLPV